MNEQVEKTVATFDKYADRYQSKFSEYDAYTETYEAFCKLLTTTHTTVLDVACGPGNMSEYVLSKLPGAKVHGIDLAPRMIELARLANPEATFDLMDTRDIGRLDQKFDVVMCGFGLPYISQPELKIFIHDAAKLLNDNGLIYLSAMEAGQYHGGYDTNKDGDQVYVHHHEFKFVEAQLCANGFAILDVERKPYMKDDGEVVTDLFIYGQLSR